MSDRVNPIVQQQVDLTAQAVRLIQRCVERRHCSNDNFSSVRSAYLAQTYDVQP